MDEETLTVWLDTALLMLGGFILMTVLMLAAMNPPKPEQQEGQIVNPGTMIIEAEWADDLDADVDLWVRAPNERPVGYSNKSAPIFNLLRDDLGKQADISNVNHEEAFARGTIEGEYVVNVHAYRCNDPCKYPIKVHLIAHGQPKGKGEMTTYATADVVLIRDNDQITAFRFILDANGNVVSGSLNHLFQELRVAQ